MSTELTTPIKIEIPGIGTIESADLYLKAEADKVIAHQKYKRCLAMAFLSLEKRETYRAEYEEWCLKWYKRWLELSEKFKETK
jgi:hypothetical protein